MTKIVYNACFGGFRLSSNAVQLGREISGDPMWGEDQDDIPRHDPVLVQVVEQLGVKACTRVSNLCIAEVPSGTEYRIDEYDGAESVQTKDSYDWIVAP